MTTENDDDDFDPDAAVADIAAGMEEQAASQPPARTHDDFVYVASENAYRDLNIQIDQPLTDRAVDALIPIWRVVDGDPPRRVRPSSDIRNDPAKVCASIQWVPGKPRLVRGEYLTDKGETVFDSRTQILNTYFPPPPHAGDATKATPWIELVEKLIPNEIERIAMIEYLAAMIQYPERKVNCGVLLAGRPGIGKDSMLEPIRKAVGPSNSDIIDPHEIFDKFNPWARNVMLTINEMEPGQEHTAWELIKRLKRYTAAPPHGLSVQDKNIKRYVIRNVVRIFAMTNDLNSIYMEEDQRRWLVLDMNHLAARWHLGDDPDYFSRYYAWVDAGGWQDVSAYLHSVDLSNYQFESPLVDTEASKKLVDVSNDAPDDAFSAAISALNNPHIVFGFELKEAVAMSTDGAKELEGLFKSHRNLVRRASKNGYRVVGCPASDADRALKNDRRWAFKIPNTNQLLKAKVALVKIDIPESEEFWMIEKRGKELAAGRAKGGVTNSGNGGNVHPFPTGKL